MKYYVVIGKYTHNDNDIVGYYHNKVNAVNALKGINKKGIVWRDKANNIVNFDDYTPEEIINNYIHFYNYYDYCIEEREILFND